VGCKIDSDFAVRTILTHACGRCAGSHPSHCRLQDIYLLLQMSSLLFCNVCFYLQKHFTSCASNASELMALVLQSSLQPLYKKRLKVIAFIVNCIFLSKINIYKKLMPYDIYLHDVSTSHPQRQSSALKNRGRRY